MKRKTVSLPIDVYDLLSMIKEEYEAEKEQRQSYHTTVFMLCQFYLTQKNPLEDNEQFITDLEKEEQEIPENKPPTKSEYTKTLEKEIQEKTEKLNETNDFLKKAFMTMLEKLPDPTQQTQTQPIIISGGAPLQQTQQLLPASQAEESLKKQLSEDEIKKMQEELLQNEEGNFVDELDNITELSGGIVSPSMILKLRSSNDSENPFKEEAESLEEYQERRAKEIKEAKNRKKKKPLYTKPIEVESKKVHPKRLKPPP